MKESYGRELPAEWAAMSKVFVALGDPHRQRILLLFEKGERLSIGQIVDVSTLARSSVSHHLRVLRESGVLSSEKVGKEVFFWVNADAISESMQSVLDYLKKHF